MKDTLVTEIQKLIDNDGLQQSLSLRGLESLKEVKTQLTKLEDERDVLEGKLDRAECSILKLQDQLLESESENVKLKARLADIEGREDACQKLELELAFNEARINGKAFYLNARADEMKEIIHLLTKNRTIREHALTDTPIARTSYSSYWDQAAQANRSQPSGEWVERDKVEIVTEKEER